jgi:hypothetical protein
MLTEQSSKIGENVCFIDLDGHYETYSYEDKDVLLGMGYLYPYSSRPPSNMMRATRALDELY